MDAYLDSLNRPKPRRVPSPQELDLFAQSGAEDHAAEIALLIPVAQRLAREAGRAGVTIADVREEASRRGILPPIGEGRSLSYLGSLMKRAGLVATDRVRRSHVEGAHGNRNTIWISTEYRENAA